MQMIGRKIGALMGSIAVISVLAAGMVPAAAVADPVGQSNVPSRAVSPITGTSYAYSMIVGGVTYTGSAVQAQLPDGVKPAGSVVVSQVRTDKHEDGSTSTSSSQTTVQGRIVDDSVSRDDDITVRLHRGTAVYEATIDGQKYSARLGYRYGESSAYHLVVNGRNVPFTRQADGSWGVAESDKPTFVLSAGTSDQLAPGQRINVSNDGTLENVTPTGWGTPSFDAYTLVNTFRISGSVEGTSWSVQLKAARPVEHTGRVTDEDRSVRVAGRDVPLSKEDGAWKAAIPGFIGEPAKTLDVRAVHHRLYENGKWKPEEDTTTTYRIAAGRRDDKVSYPDFGVRQHDGTQSYAGKDDRDDADTRVSVDYSYTEGSRLQLKRSSGELTTLTPRSTPATSGTIWSIGDESPVTFGLTGSNRIDEAAALTFTDREGASRTALVKDAKITYEDKQIVQTEEALIVRVTGSVSGKLSTPGGDFAYEIPYVADRTYNDGIKSLRVTETAADGTTATYDQSLNEAKTTGSNQYQYTLPRLPYSHMASSYAIAGVDAGADVTITTSTAQRNDDGSLTFTVLARSPHYTNTYQVSIPFEPAPVVPNANAAHLSDITINGKSIKDVNGSGFDPDRLSYTVKAAENDKVYILPVAAPGIFVSAGDVTQSAGSSTYRWIVTQQGKTTTTYSVTVLRIRDWKTADEAFTPKQPIRQEGTQTAGEHDTDLQSHGYVDADGKYVTVDKDKYTIPDGGVFSYQAKTGQVAIVTTTKIKGMTYRYTVNIAAPGDLKNFVQHVFTVTYITPATQVAVLTGIKVNGHDIPHFNPDTRQYTVEVPRTDQWTIVPQYDERSGMSVHTHKNGADASITTTSADGLVTRNYTVHVTAAGHPRAENGTAGILAQAGSSITPIIITCILLVIFSTLSILLPRWRRTR